MTNCDLGQLVEIGSKRRKFLLLVDQPEFREPASARGLFCRRQQSAPNCEEDFSIRTESELDDSRDTLWVILILELKGCHRPHLSASLFNDSQLSSSASYKSSS